MGLVIALRRVRVFGDVVIPEEKSLMWFAPGNKFKDMANKGVINLKLLGVTKYLALFHVLISPLWKKYTFSPEDFGKGAKLVLQQYYNTQRILKKSIQLMLSYLGQSNFYLKFKETLSEEQIEAFASMKQMVTLEFMKGMVDIIAKKARDKNLRHMRTKIVSVSLVYSKSYTIAPYTG